MKLLESNIVISKVLISEEEYEKLRDFFGDDRSEQLAEEYRCNDDGAGLCIVIDEEKEIYYEIIAERTSFEHFLYHECFSEYNGCGYNDNLIGLYNHIGKYAYVLSIANWSEDNDMTSNRINKVYNLIENRMVGIKHDAVNILSEAIDILRDELYRELCITLVEKPVVKYVKPNPGKSRYYSIDLTNNLYELLRDMFRYKIKETIKKDKFKHLGSVEYGVEGMTLREFDDSYTGVYIDKTDQQYKLYLTKAKSYELCKYSDMEYNEYILPDKNVLIEIFKALKDESVSGCPEHYEHIIEKLINLIEKSI